MTDSQRRTIEEPSRQTPVRGRWDVIVAGGGLGGVAAATAAARAGAHTLLIERNGFLGGVATAGMCCSIFNCYYTSDRRPAVTGIPVEVADKLATAAGYGTKWHKHKGHVIYDVEQAKGVLAELVLGAGAEVLYDTTVSSAVMDDHRLRGIIVESKAGREALLADVVVDATGDADVAALAGAPLHTTPPWSKHSLVFRLGNVDLDAFVTYFRDHPDQYPEYMDVEWTVADCLAQYDDTGTFLFPHGGGYQLEIIKRGIAENRYLQSIGMHDSVAALQMHGLRDPGVLHLITGFADVGQLDIARISRAMNDGRKMAYHVAGFFRQEVPGMQRARIIATADDLGIRTSRWIDGEFAFTKQMRTSAWRADDAVGRGVVYTDEKRHPAENAWGCQVMHDDTFDVSYRCLVPRRVDGLLMGAGRSVSADDPGLLRVMVMTMVVGQAAGTAAAVSSQSHTAPRSVSTERVRQELKDQSVELNG